MSTSLSPHLPQPGELILGRYEVTAAIGGNAHELVYEARDNRTQRRVAIRWSLASEQASSRFCHSSVFETLEVAKVRGAQCTVLDWCAGESLEARLGRLGPQPMAELARLLAPCIRGVMAAHVAGIVQHVIKPTTIYLCAAEAGQPEQVKLLPFELDARRAQQLLAAALRGAETGAHRLPESRAALLADPRADVRAFGAIAYLALTGQRHGQHPASPASLRPIERWFIERSLSETCDRPFQTLAELVAALENMSSTMPRAAVDRHSPAEALPAKSPSRSPGPPSRDDPSARRRTGPITARQRRIPRQAHASPAAASMQETPAVPESRPAAATAPQLNAAGAQPAADSGRPIAPASTAPANLAPSTEHPLVWVPTRPQLGRGAGAQLATRHAFSQLPTQPLPRIRKLPELDRTLELSPGVPTLSSLSRSAYGLAEQLLGLGRPRQQTRVLASLAGALVIVAFILSLLPDRRRASTPDAPLADNRPLARAAVTVAAASAPPYVAVVDRAPPIAAARAPQQAKPEPSRAASSRRAPRPRVSQTARSATRALPRDKRSGRSKDSAPAAAPPRAPVRLPPKPASEEALDQMGLL